MRYIDGLALQTELEHSGGRFRPGQILYKTDLPLQPRGTLISAHHLWMAGCHPQEVHCNSQCHRKGGTGHLTSAFEEICVIALVCM